MDYFDDSNLDLDPEGIIPAIVIGAVQAIRPENTPRNTGQPGKEYLHELLQCGSSKRIYEVLRMEKVTFLKLCDWLECNTALQSLRYIGIQEQVAMFLWTINYLASNRQVMERF